VVAGTVTRFRKKRARQFGLSKGHRHCSARAALRVEDHLLSLKGALEPSPRGDRQHRGRWIPLILGRSPRKAMALRGRAVEGQGGRERERERERERVHILISRGK
jgi:hypothetical protein